MELRRLLLPNPRRMTVMIIVWLFGLACILLAFKINDN